MRPDIEFEMWVRQPVEIVMAQVEKDAAHFKITEEELNRAVFGWVMGRVAGKGIPDWLEKELSKLTE